MSAHLLCPLCGRRLIVREDFTAARARDSIAAARDEHAPTCPYYPELNAMLEDIYPERKEAKP